jgi:hypothetical protein
MDLCILTKILPKLLLHVSLKAMSSVHISNIVEYIHNTLDLVINFAVENLKTNLRILYVYYRSIHGGNIFTYLT